MTDSLQDDNEKHEGDETPEVPQINSWRKYPIVTTDDWRDMYTRYLTDGTISVDDKLLAKLKRDV